MALEVNRQAAGLVDQQPTLESGQAATWTGAGGRGWAAAQDLIDELFQPIEELLVEALSATGGNVLDVGCGTGGTTVAVARHLGADGSCTGIDLSEPMLVSARRRAERQQARASFILGNAQTYPFEPASFDAVISRFGVMFFDDAVKAFENLRRAAKSDAVLRCVVWRSAEHNPFMTTAERAATPLLPELPTRKPHEPGQFGLADADRARSILKASGWAEVELEPVDVPCAMPETALVHYLTHLGPVGRLLLQADDELRARVVAAILPAFDSYVHDATVRFTAACWLLKARAREATTRWSGLDSEPQQGHV